MTWGRLSDAALRDGVAVILSDALTKGMGRRLSPSDPLVDAASRRLCYLGLVSPDIAADDRKIVDNVLRLTFGRPSLRLIVQGTVPEQALMDLAAFAQEMTLAENGRQKVTPEHAVAADLARVWLACGLQVSRSTTGAFFATLEAVLREILGTGDKAESAARWVVRHLPTITAMDEKADSRVN